MVLTDRVWTLLVWKKPGIPDILPFFTVERMKQHACQLIYREISTKLRDRPLKVLDDFSALYVEGEWDKFLEMWLKEGSGWAGISGFAIYWDTEAKAIL
jgi:hypothetical protein